MKKFSIILMAFGFLGLFLAGYGASALNEMGSMRGLIMSGVSFFTSAGRSMEALKLVPFGYRLGIVTAAYAFPLFLAGLVMAVAGMTIYSWKAVSGYSVSGESF